MQRPCRIFVVSWGAFMLCAFVRCLWPFCLSLYTEQGLSLSSPPSSPDGLKIRSRLYHQNNRVYYVYLTTCRESRLSDECAGTQSCLCTWVVRTQGIASVNSANKGAASPVNCASAAATGSHALVLPWEFQETQEASQCCNPLLILDGAHMQFWHTLYY